tara:strand:- start:10523 stop:11758 length:1236 start_codon:yes stop_codon:yes gene_type:complete
MANGGTNTIAKTLNLGGFGGKLQDFVDNYGTLIGAAGQLASTESAVNKLEGMGKDAKEFIGFPGGTDLYNTIAGTTTFKPFGVTGLPMGSVQTDAQGGANFALSDEQTALAKSLRTGGSSLIDAVLGRGQYGTFDPATGQYTDDMRSGQADLMRLLEVGDKNALGQTYRDLQQQNYMTQLTDPFSAANLAEAEQTAYDRMRAIRTPEEERAQIGLNQSLIGQGRQGLQTAQYGGSPEQFALSKAIEEQKASDALAAMGMARQDAQSLANQRALAMGEARTDQTLRSQQRLSALGQQALEKELGANIAGSFLTQSYAPQTALIQAMQPSIDLANISTAARRDLGGQTMNLGQSYLDYDLGTRGAATNLRNQTLQGLFDLLIAKEAGSATRDAAATNSGGGMSWQDYKDAMGL